MSGSAHGQRSGSGLVSSLAAWHQAAGTCVVSLHGSPSHRLGCHFAGCCANRTKSARPERGTAASAWGQVDGRERADNEVVVVSIGLGKTVFAALPLSKKDGIWRAKYAQGELHPSVWMSVTEDADIPENSASEQRINFPFLKANLSKNFS